MVTTEAAGGMHISVLKEIVAVRSVLSDDLWPIYIVQPFLYTDSINLSFEQHSIPQVLLHLCQFLNTLEKVWCVTVITREYMG